jgi:hypothetical protein
MGLVDSHSRESTHGVHKGPDECLALDHGPSLQSSRSQRMCLSNSEMSSDCLGMSPTLKTVVMKIPALV